MTDIVNKSETKIDDSFINDFKAIQRQLREMKTSPQGIGSDSLRIGGIPALGAYSVGPLTITAGSTFTAAFNFSPTVANTTMWNFLYTIYCDSLATGFQAPGGSALSAAQNKVRVFGRDDYAGFSTYRATAGRTLLLSVENFDVSSHNYWIFVYALIPIASGSPVA